MLDNLMLTKEQEKDFNKLLPIIQYILKYDMKIDINNIYDYNDLLQEGAIALCRGIKTFDPSYDVQLSTYCYKCVSNKLLSIFVNPKNKKIPVFEDKEPLEAPAYTNAEEQGVTDFLLGLKKSCPKNVHKGIDILVLLLKKLTMEEICQKLNINAKSYYNYLYLARKYLRNTEDVMQFLCNCS